jgi:glycine/D-amino acid oxidase-like deaminating enzyme
MVGYMGGYFERERLPPAAISFIKNDRIGGDLPYAYVTRRTYDTPAGDATLTCVGGPEKLLDVPIDDFVYDDAEPVPAAKLEQLDVEVRSVIDDPGGPDAYDFAWHGLMGYTQQRVRLIGFEPKYHALLYNLGCNGVGILPSIHGGHRIARLLAGNDLGPSMFDPALQ